MQITSPQERLVAVVETETVGVITVAVFDAVGVATVLVGVGVVETVGVGTIEVVGVTEAVGVLGVCVTDTVRLSVTDAVGVITVLVAVGVTGQRVVSVVTIL